MSVRGTARSARGQERWGGRAAPPSTAARAVGSRGRSAPATRVGLITLLVAACSGSSTMTGPPPGSLKFASVVAGSATACGLTSNGQGTWCWGNNNAGQLGNGTTTASTAPVQVVGGLTFGSVSVSDGGGFTCAVTPANAAYCWGNNDVGNLGDSLTTSSATPVAVAGQHPFAAVSAGATFACGVTPSNAAYCWGENSGGNLGTGSTSLSLVPVAVAGTLVFRQVSAGTGYSFACGVTTTNAAYCWGWNVFGQLGDSTTTGPQLCNGLPCSPTPVAVAGGRAFNQVSAGGNFACGVTLANAAYCWGSNAFGVLGNGDTTGRASPVPVAVAGGLSFSAVSAGGSFACGLTTSGAAYCWGLNNIGQLGDSSQRNSTVPVAVRGGQTFATITAGDLAACGLTTGGVVYCWGNNGSGELGDGSTQTSSVPVKVSGQP